MNENKKKNKIRYYKRANFNLKDYFKLIPQMLFLPLFHMALRLFLIIIKWDSIKRSINKKIYKKTYSSEDIIALMKNMGLKNGSNVFVHSSFNDAICVLNDTASIFKLINGYRFWKIEKARGGRRWGP